MVLTTAPLQVNTLFEVRLDKKMKPNPLVPITHSVEIGVTSNNPSTLRLPDTMTDLTYGKSWMLSGSELAFNGKKLQSFTKTNLNELQVTISIIFIISSFQLPDSG